MASDVPGDGMTGSRVSQKWTTKADLRVGLRAGTRRGGVKAERASYRAGRRLGLVDESTCSKAAARLYRGGDVTGRLGGVTEGVVGVVDETESVEMEETERSPSRKVSLEDSAQSRSDWKSSRELRLEVIDGRDRGEIDGPSRTEECRGGGVPTTSATVRTA